MSDCSDYPTAQTAKTFKLDAVTQNEVVTLEQDRTNPASDSKTKKTFWGIESDATNQRNEIDQLAETQRENLESTFTAQFAYKRIGNISLYVGDSLTEVDKLNSYQYPDDSGEWYGPTQDQAFPITIPSDPSSDNGWALVNALTSDSLSVYTDIVYKASGGNSAFENMIDESPIPSNIGDICYTEGTQWRVVAKSSPRVPSDFYPIEAVDVRGMMKGADSDVATQFTLDNYENISLGENIAHNFNGNTVTIPNNRTIYTNKSVSINNGELSAIRSNVEGIEIAGHLIANECDVKISGGYRIPNHGKNIKLGDVTYTSCQFSVFYLGTEDELGVTCGDVTGYEPEPLNNRQRMMGNIANYNSKFGKLFFKGHYAMAFETAGNSPGGDVPYYAGYNNSYESITSLRDPSFAGTDGLHGVYLHGNYECSFGPVRSTGYFSTTSDNSRVALKTRDNWDCTHEEIVADKMHIASDANSTAPLNSHVRNIYKKINLQFDPGNLGEAGELYITTNGQGRLTNNEIKWLKAVIKTGGSVEESGFGGVIFNGHVEIMNQSNLQTSSLSFNGAHVEWAFPGLSILNAVKGSNTHFDFDITTTSSVYLDNCRVSGLLRQQPPNGSTARDLELRNTSVDGSIRSISSASITPTNSIIENVSSGDTNPPSNGLPTGAKRWRMWSFSDGYYLDESAFNSTP